MIPPFETADVRLCYERMKDLCQFESVQFEVVLRSVIDTYPIVPRSVNLRYAPLEDVTYMVRADLTEIIDEHSVDFNGQYWIRTSDILRVR